jgi:hypothetical protein
MLDSFLCDVKGLADTFWLWSCQPDSNPVHCECRCCDVVKIPGVVTAPSLNFPGSPSHGDLGSHNCILTENARDELLCKVQQSFVGAMMALGPGSPKYVPLPSYFNMFGCVIFIY